MINYDQDVKNLMYIYQNREIMDFFYNVFSVYEIRARIDESNGVIFEVRTKEHGHNMPHVHAKYGKYNISISIEDGQVLSGNLPPKKQKLAVEWVKKNRSMLENKWNNIVIKDNWCMTKSNLDIE